MSTLGHKRTFAGSDKKKDRLVAVSPKSDQFFIRRRSPVLSPNNGNASLVLFPLDTVVLYPPLHRINREFRIQATTGNF